MTNPPELPVRPEAQPLSPCTEGARSLDERLANVALPEGAEAGTYIRKGSEALLGGVLEAIPGGAILTKLKAAVDAGDAAIREQKRDLLFEAYLDQTERSQERIQALIDFVTNPWGNALFAKLQQILVDNPPDRVMTENLARVLRSISAKPLRTELRHDELLGGTVTPLRSPPHPALGPELSRYRRRHTPLPKCQTGKCQPRRFPSRRSAQLA